MASRAPPAAGLEPLEGATLLLVLRAFASGATAMTGIEAISNTVLAFKEPSSHNARIVLTVMVCLLVAMFGGLIVLMRLEDTVPQPGQTALSQLAHSSFGTGPVYAFVQGATAVVLLLAANSAFNGFPRLLSFMARNGHAAPVPPPRRSPGVQQRHDRSRCRRRAALLRRVRRAHRRVDTSLRRRGVRRVYVLAGRYASARHADATSAPP
jgi:amino acid transporter